MTNREDFKAKVKATLALRAAHFCSNPRCLKLTIGPHSDPKKSLKSGHAAHIHAASKGGPRYDPSQTVTERTSIENGLWLCRECGIIVDGDESNHTPEQLRRWRSDHEIMMTEIRTEGYSSSLALLQSGRMEPQIAKKIVSAMTDRRSLWVTFDAESPERVRQSLDELRSRFSAIRGDLLDGTALDQVLLSLTSTILKFFDTMESIDLRTLVCSSNDPDWLHFNDALATLRKTVGRQIADLASAYHLTLSTDLQSIAPLRN